ncbi:MAG: hypothetical protein HGA99_00625 [Chlorobiaceae bacterium]|nr:hypothetical protein [Chlorobiaceae bacterium]
MHAFRSCNRAYFNADRERRKHQSGKATTASRSISHDAICDMIVLTGLCANTRNWFHKKRKFQTTGFDAKGDGGKDEMASLQGTSN